VIRSTLVAAGLIASSSHAWAHGTGWRLTDEKAVTVELYYADGEEMPFADVRVFSPLDQASPVLHGRADARGRIAFVPDRDGTWTVIASDGDGHGVNAPIPVTLGAVAIQPTRAPLEMRLMLIGSVVLNVSLLLFAWSRFAISRRHTAQIRA